MFRKTKIALSAVMSLAFVGAAHADDWKPVELSYSKKTQSYKLAEDFYKNFLISDPTVTMKTKTINLQTDNVPNPVGSVVVKFISTDTCSGIASENCLTTILKYDTEAQAWKEIWQHHTKVLYLGGPSEASVAAKQEGAFYHTLYTTDSLQWDWENLSGTVYEPTPIGDKFVNFTDVHKPETANESTVKYLTQTYGWPSNVPYLSQQLDIDTATNKPAYIIYPEYGPNCGRVGCTAALLVADTEGGSYKSLINNDGTFTYGGKGWIVNESGSDTGRRDIIVRNGTQLDGYVFVERYGRYDLSLTTYPSDAVESP